MGWIKLDRNLQKHWIWSKEPFSRGQAWIDLLMSACWREQKQLFKGKIQVQEVGKVYISKSYLATRWHWDRRKVDRFLTTLASDGMIRLECTTDGTVIAIENYEIYQVRGTADGTSDGLGNGAVSDNEWTRDGISDGTSNGTTTSTENRTFVGGDGTSDGTSDGASDGTHTKNNKKDKKDKNINNISRARARPTVDEIQAYCDERLNGIDAQQFFDYYEARGWKYGTGKPMVDWKAAVRTWERNRKPSKQDKPVSFMDL
nr:MAG TPA: DNA polymerase [Caudoviricetes sp.]